MSVDYDAYAVLGVRLREAQLYDETKERGCSYDIDRLGMTGGMFCPACGKPAWVKSHKPITQYDPDKNTFADLKVIPGNEGDDTVLVCGAVVRMNCRMPYRGEPAFLPMDSIVSFVQAYARVKGTLEPLGLWDQASFGLYAYLGVG